MRITSLLIIITLHQTNETPLFMKVHWKTGDKTEITNVDLYVSMHIYLLLTFIFPVTHNIVNRIDSRIIFFVFYI